MPKLSRLADRRGPVHGHWRLDGAWLEHRGPADVRRLPVDVVLAALDAVGRDGGLHRDGTVATDRVRGVRAHHPEHGRYAVELRASRWWLSWHPRGAAAQRVELAGAAEQVARRSWSRDVAA